MVSHLACFLGRLLGAKGEHHLWWDGAQDRFHRQPVLLELDIASFHGFPHMSRLHDDFHQKRSTWIVSSREGREGGTGHAHVAHEAWRTQLTSRPASQRERVRCTCLLTRDLLSGSGGVTADAVFGHMLRNNMWL